MYLLKLALRPWKQAPLSQAFTSIAVGVLLFMVGFMYWLQQGLKPVVERLNTEQVITAYLDPNLQPKEEDKVVDTLKTSLGAQALTEIKLIEQRDFIERVKQQNPDLARELEDLGDESAGVIPRYVSITGLFGDEDLKSIRTTPGVESAETSKERHKHIIGAFSVLGWVARVLAIGLCIALLTGLVHLTRMNAYLYRDTLSLMRLWGANVFTLRVPSMVAGLSVGFAGGLMGWIAWGVIGAGLVGHIRTFSPFLREMPVLGGAAWIGPFLLLAGMVLGSLAGALGGFSALQSGSARR